MSFNVIDLSEYREDLVERANSRLLSQFKNSELLKQFLSAFILEAQELHDAAVDMVGARTVAGAEGVNLDVLGRIVGARRTFEDWGSIGWFTADEQGQGWDSGVLWCTNANQYGTGIMTDASFRQAIEQRIVSNFVRFASIPELTDLINDVTGIEVGFQVTAPFEVTLYVPSSASMNQVRLLTGFVDSARMDKRFFFPYPVTLNIQDVFFYVPMTAFAPDREQAGADVGQWSVKGVAA
jgi:hypothetical protein